LKIGAISYCYHRLELPALLAKFKEIGLKNIELWRGHPDGRANYMERDRHQAQDTRALIEGYGIAPQAYCIGGFTATDAPRFRRAFEFAAGLGVEVMTGCAVPEILPELDSLCQEYQIRFAIENHRGNPFQGPDDYTTAFQTASPMIGVNFDTGHLRAAHLDVVESARKLLDRIYHVHLKDIADPATAEPSVLGQGAAHIGEFLELMKARGYHGHLSIEHEIPADPTEDLKQCLAFVSKHVA
jgi:sugar phosphate isomerase/epimerase